MATGGVEMIGAARVARGLYWGRAWNLVGGCTKVSPACGHCWAEWEAYRYRSKPFYAGLTDEAGHWTGEIRVRGELLDLPLHVRKPTVWAVWTDLFHPAVPDDFVEAAWNTMRGLAEPVPYGGEHAVRLTSPHRFLVLTKRPERMRSFLTHRLEQQAKYADSFADCPTEAMRHSPAAIGARQEADPSWLHHIACGVTAENQEQTEARIPLLLQTPAAMRFVSYEPALGPLNLRYWLYGAGLIERCEDKLHPMGFRMEDRGWEPPVDWVIVGCESGPGRRPTRLEWVRDVVRQCREAGVPCFVKQLEVPRNLSLPLPEDQWGFWVSRKGGRVSHDPSEWPEDLRVRELPAFFTAEGGCATQTEESVNG